MRPEKWNVAEQAPKKDKEEAFKKFKKLEEVITKQEKITIVKEARVFIQEQFRSLDPNQAVEDLQSFWEAGPDILSEWFEWLTGDQSHEHCRTLHSRQEK